MTQSSGKSILEDLKRKVHIGNSLMAKANMTNQTVDLLLRVTRLILVRAGITDMQFKQRHRVWYNSNYDQQTKSTLNASKNSYSKAITGADKDNTSITWAKATKILEICGLDIKSISIVLYDKNTGKDIVVSSDSHYEKELEASKEDRELPSIDDHVEL